MCLMYISGTQYRVERRCKKIIDESLSEHDFNGGIVEIRAFEQIPNITAQKRVTLEVY